MKIISPESLLKNIEDDLNENKNSHIVEEYIYKPNILEKYSAQATKNNEKAYRNLKSGYTKKRTLRPFSQAKNDNKIIRNFMQRKDLGNFTRKMIYQGGRSNTSLVISEKNVSMPSSIGKRSDHLNTCKFIDTYS